jgi:hypothetical protein
VYWEPVLITLDLFVPLASLMHDNIYDLILLADVLGGHGHEAINHLIKQLGVTASVVSYARYKLAYGFFVL